MDPISALGIAAAVVQFLDVSVKVSKRFTEFASANSGQVPRSLEGITTQLPLLFNVLSRIKSEADVGKYDADTQAVLHGVVFGCLKLARELDEIASKLAPVAGENMALKLKKTLSSLKSEDRIAEIERGLKAYVQVLILNQVVSRTELPVLPLEDKKYFEVKETLESSESYTERSEILARIHTAFFAATRKQEGRPVYATLQGPKACGKTQIALRYAHESYDMGHYSSVFWLDASSPKLLEASLENAAAVIRRTKAGSWKEKLEFLHSFLDGSVQPWLLILDNYCSESWRSESFAALLPGTGHGAILLTTRENMADAKSVAGEVVRVYKLVTGQDRLDICRAILNKEADKVIDALANGLDPNCLSPYGSPKAPMINEAAEVGFTAVVQLMLDMGADLHLKKEQDSVLGKAASNGHSEVVSLCLDYDDLRGGQLTHQAYEYAFGGTIRHGHIDVLTVLLARRGREVEVDSRWLQHCLWGAAEEGRVEVFRFLNSAGRLHTDKFVIATALYKAVKARSLAMTELLIADLHADPDVVNDDGTTAVFGILDQSMQYETAKTETLVAILNLLLDAGANPSALSRGDRGSPPLVDAVRNKLNWAIVPLLDHGADPAVKDDVDYVSSLLDRGKANALKHAVIDGFSEAITTLTDVHLPDPKAQEEYYTEALFLAAARGNRDLVLKVVKKADIDSIDDNDGDTSLIKAIKSGHHPVARMLVRSGARLDIADKKGVVPLLWAAKNGMHLLIRDLVGRKDAPGLESSDQKGNTPLILAVQPGPEYEKTVQALLKAGSDKSAMNDYGETALDIAEDKGFQEILTLLEACSVG